MTRDLSNPLYDYDVPALNQSYTRNGLNQYTAVGGATFSYSGGDGQRGNLTSDGVRTFDYDLENRLISVTGPASMTLEYDPLGRLRTTMSGGVTTTLLYSGDQLVMEYNGSTILRRYAFGAGVDRPLIWYEGADLSSRRSLHADELGSVIATTNGSANTVYAYGPYGEPDAANGWTGSRFRYTGQIMLPQAQLYHYKARVYDPRLGRFLQTDPVGYEDDLNLYAYVGNDPLNAQDPTGRRVVLTGKDEPRAELVALTARATGLSLSESKGVLVAGPNAEATNLAGQNVLDAIRSPDSIFLNAIDTNANVLVDSFASGSVDVGDINAMAAKDERLAGALLTHIISEQRGFEAGDTYDVAHGQALRDEAAVMGATTRIEGGDPVPGGRFTFDYLNTKGQPVISFVFKFDSNFTPR